MGTTPVFAFPYIEPTDTLAAYPAADHAQALAVEAALTGAAAAFGWAKQSSAQSIPTATFTTLAGLALDATASGGVTLSGNSLRAPTAGLYLINAYVTFAHNTAGGRSMFIRRNGANQLRVVGGPSTATPTMGASLAYPLAAGDLIEIQAYQSSGAALNTDPGSNGCSFQLIRL